MENINWLHYIILVGLSVIGVLAVLPYTFEIKKEQMAKAPLSRRQIVLVSMVQSAILFAIITLIGLLATNAIGLSVTSPIEVIPFAILFGFIGGFALILLEQIIFKPHLPPALKKGEGHIALWKRVSASLYGGVNEEVLMRLFLVSGIAWVLAQIGQTPAGLPSDGMIWLAIILASILFGIGHLPATAAMTRLTSVIIVRALVLNGIIGILNGWIFWQYGLVAAIIAHFSADIILHVVAPLLISQPEEIRSTTVNHTI